jgi:Holliday junction resolvasome RuvABC DNA-binding subunit
MLGFKDTIFRERRQVFISLNRGRITASQASKALIDLGYDPLDADQVVHQHLKETR